MQQNITKKAKFYKLWLGQTVTFYRLGLAFLHYFLLDNTKLIIILIIITTNIIMLVVMILVTIFVIETEAFQYIN